MTPEELRLACRDGSFTSHTSGYCAGFVQANLVILPKDWADEFFVFAQQNPKACPIVAFSKTPGDPILNIGGKEIDIRSDLPQYRVWREGEMTDEPNNVADLWQDDFVTFLIGCSFSFEEALLADGLEIRNISEKKNVPMFNTNMACQPTERFYGNQVVSMRPFKAADAIRMIQICSRFPDVHGAPVHLGDPALIGISDIQSPDYGEAVTVNDDELPVFTACGVTPQAVIKQAKPPICITHSPGAMLVTDIPNSKLAVF
ncbi:putative hydro-lyase [Reinekea thalattae]|uniref:Putative hydro-lyase FME95_07715 n=1 Tax=Reinekea thalattae TaxID=2593301 RepID=A0A5C8ZAF5_9GAMM|nr:putative hydro-lyase [Reinekea thalattae]TXR54414.1 putative hydro-lyase [Reinekea thalattae]